MGRKPSYAIVMNCLRTDGLLVEDGVNGDGRLAGLSITDDQLTLPAANGNQTVHCLQACGPDKPIALPCFDPEHGGKWLGMLPIGPIGLKWEELVWAGITV